MFRHPQKFILWFVLVIIFSFFPSVTQAADTRCFPETGQCISGAIRQYWERNGGLSVFGFPKGAQTRELVEGVPLNVQWFERDRLEIQPNGLVTAGRLGARVLELQGTSWQFGPQERVNGCQIFAETGHRMCGEFARFWQRNGGVNRFGFPISNEFVTTIEGRPLTVQYFERRRFELHPGNQVLLGLLGNEVQSIQQYQNWFYNVPTNPHIHWVNAEGPRLMAGGVPFEVRGMNYVRATGVDANRCWSLQFGADANCPWDVPAMTADLDRLRGLGVNTVRLFLNYYVFGGAVPVFDKAGRPNIALQHLEELINLANARGMYVIPVLLIDHPKHEMDPDHYDSAIRLHVRPLVSYFANRPGILAWDVFNEPDIGSEVDLRCWDWDNADYPECFPLAEKRMRFVEAMLREVKALDPNRLRTTGLAFAKSHFEPRESALRIADMVDFYTFHYYDDSPYDSGRYKAHWYYGKGFTRDLYRSLQELKALGQNKPIVVTEIGFVTNGREATRTLAQHHTDLKLARELIRESGGAGLMIWSFQSTFDDAIGDVFPR